ncbi:alpha/beta hydrolase [Halobacillus halophilus]|uniref:alpha/beta hydrolase n=1 Tax=Halobacillus halophilus TaxID=1570 RepID=UPI00136FA70B|nr:alpha/beta hydrolase [Halobacillus halophilus]MYL31232.1 alpha/beta hydrolase [Halobacillus halophilus]
MKKWLLYILAGMFTLALLAFGAFYIWAEQTYEASDQLSDIPERQGDWLIFEPDGEPKAGVVLYPGAKVEPEAYSYIGNHLQEQGYLTAIPSMRFNFPILEAQKADDILERYPLDEWFIGGHSLGGVAAAAYAGENQKQLSGLFFLASYPSDQDDFSDTDFPVLSIYGEKDGLTTLSDIEEKKYLLSDAAVLYEIKGGNHAQFGWYGEQKGDHPADIPVQEQQDIIVEKLMTWLEASWNKGYGL